MKSLFLLVLVMIFSFHTYSQSLCKIELVKIGTKISYGELIEDKNVPRIPVNGEVYIGEYCKLLVTNRTNKAKYFYILDFQPDGIINLLFPNAKKEYLPDQYKIKAGKTMELGDYDIIGYAPPYGRETFLAVFSDEPIDFYLSEKRTADRKTAISKEDLYWMLEGKPGKEHEALIFFRVDFEIMEKEIPIEGKEKKKTVFKRSEVPSDYRFICPALTFINPPEVSYDVRGAQLINPKTQSKSMVIKGNIACLDSINEVIVSTFSNSDITKYSVKNFSNAMQTVFFEKQVELNEGTNRINVNVISKNGFAVTEDLMVDYIPDNSPQAKGKDVMLLLAVNDYQYWPKLKNPVSDVKSFAQILIDHYGFEESNVITLFNEKFNENSLDSLFRNLITKLNANDRLLVYYAGHGYYDTVFNEGFWIPYNGETQGTQTFITNATISKYIKTLKTKHVLFIADACFSGGYLTSEGRGAETYFDKLNLQKSRWVFASGGMEEVADDYQGKGHSPFAWYLMEYLKKPVNSIFSVSELSIFVTKSVANNTHQKPIARPVQAAGDEGGEFIFSYR